VYLYWEAMKEDVIILPIRLEYYKARVSNFPDIGGKHASKQWITKYRTGLP
jgi:hypothetical protein